LQRKRWEELFHYFSYPFPILMIDGVTELEKEKQVQAVKYVSANETYLAGHFPGEPIMPGVLTVEGLIQSCLILVGDSFPRGRIRVSLEKVSRVKFKRAILSGDRVDFSAALISRDGVLWKFKGKARVGEETSAEADIFLKVAVREVGFEL
jgi:3-hydroxyacyl-[acyl-carrier-protein] dehydratase